MNWYVLAKVVILALHHDFQALDRRRFTRDDVEVCYVGQMHVYKRGSDKFYMVLVDLLQ